MKYFTIGLAKFDFSKSCKTDCGGLRRWRLVLLLLLSAAISACGGSGGGSVDVDGGEPQPSIGSFTVTDNSINAGASTLLAWSVDNATSITISPDIGDVGADSSITITPTITTTYTLSASNAQGSVDSSVTVVVTPATDGAPSISSFTVSQSDIFEGESTTLSWMVDNAFTITISPDIGNVDAMSSVMITPTQTTTYRLIASNGLGQVEASVVVNVTPIGNELLITHFSVSSGSIPPGGSVELSWNVVNSTSVELSGGVGPVSASGSITVSPTATTTYTLTASDETDQVEASVIVAVAVASVLPIPEQLVGEDIGGVFHYNLTMQNGTNEFYPGLVSETRGYNGDLLGPTLIFNAGEDVQMHVTNNIGETSTTHWHGMHIPAVMDGGPAQKINDGDTWEPNFKIMNKASTMWYHPHLMGKTGRHVYEGLAGLIIIKDAESNALDLPDSYGVDDIPLIIQDRKFKDGSIFYDVDAGMGMRMGVRGEAMLVNGAITPTFDAPKQMVRFRILNASNSRMYNIGFSDDRSFYQIGSDGGLLETALPLIRQRISPGERIEIVVNFAGDNVGDSLQLISFSSELPDNEIFSFAEDTLDNSDFLLMNINIAQATASPVTSIPSSLVTIERLSQADAAYTRTFELGFMRINGVRMDMSVVNEYVQLDDTEIWDIYTLEGNTHPFHVHDVQFEVLGRFDGKPGDYDPDGPVDHQPDDGEQGLKDTVLVKGNQTTRVLMKFEDFADEDIAYMYHCHNLEHEDGGMMGRFVVCDGNCAPAEEEDPEEEILEPEDFFTGSGDTNNSFKVMTYNAGGTSAGALFDVIDSNKPDIVGFQEVSSKDSFQDSFITAYTPGEEFEGTVYNPNGDYTFFPSPNLTNSNPLLINTNRFTVLDSNGIPGGGLTETSKPTPEGTAAAVHYCASTTNTIEKGTFHALSDFGKVADVAINPDSRWFSWVYLEDNDSPEKERYVVYTSHFVAPMTEPFAACIHEYQAARFLDELVAQNKSDLAEHKTILMCDCNDGSPATAVTTRLYKAGLIDAWRTFQSDYFDGQGTGGGIDRIWAEDLQIVSSEHLPSVGANLAHGAFMAEYDRCDKNADECATAEVPPVSEPPTDPDVIGDEDLEHVLISHGCHQCHGDGQQAADMNLKTGWKEALLGPDLGGYYEGEPASTSPQADCTSQLNPVTGGTINRVEPGYPGQSLLYMKVVLRQPCGRSMPRLTRGYAGSMKATSNRHGDFDVTDHTFAGGAAIIHRWIRNLGPNGDGAGFNKQTIADPTDQDIKDLVNEYGCTACHSTVGVPEWNGSTRVLSEAVDVGPLAGLDLSGTPAEIRQELLDDAEGIQNRGTGASKDQVGCSGFGSRLNILYSKVNPERTGTCGDTMPFGATMDAADAQTIYNWIQIVRSQQ